LRCAATVSARRPGTWICATAVRISGGTLRLSFTYFSKPARTVRISASLSALRVSTSSTGSTSQAKKGSDCTKVRMRARCRPSTSTFTVPSGRRRCWSTTPIVPISNRSAAPGSSRATWRCATSRSCRSPWLAASSAAIDLARPTKSGTTMCGNTTMSRSGSSGSTRCSPRWRRASSSSRKIPTALRRLRLALEHEDRLRSLLDDLLAHDHLLDVVARGDVVHEVEHDRLHDRAQAAGARLAGQRLARHGLQRALGEAQPDVLELEKLLVLLGERVARLGQDRDQRALVELVERRDDGQPADELGDHAELEQVLGLALAQHLAEP